MELDNSLGFETAARLVRVVEAWFERFCMPLDIWDKAEFGRISKGVRTQLDEPTLAAAWSMGRELTLEQAIAEARKITP